MRDRSERPDIIEDVRRPRQAAEAGTRRARSTILGIPSGLVIALMFCAVILSFGAVLFKVVAAEGEAAKRELRSVARVFENHKLFLLKDLERYAASNAAYINIETDRSQDWIQQRFGVDMALDFVHDYTALIDRNSDVLLAMDLYGRHKDAFYQNEILPGFDKTLERIRKNYVSALVRSETGDVRFAGRLADISGVDVLDIDGQPYIVSAFAIVPDPGGIRMVDKPPNILITAFEIDAIHLSNLLASLSLDNLVFAKSIPDHMIGIPLENEDGQVLGYLAWLPMSQASAIILSSIPVLVLSLGIILTVALIAVRQNANAQSDLAEREREARYAANHDPVTGFVSRGYFLAAAAKRLNLLTARGKGAWVIYLDVDNLKQVNDIHGHTVGDSLILAQARRIREAFGGYDLIGRIGGDEFQILTERWETTEDALAEIGPLFESLRQPVDCDGKRIETSVSAGIARFPDHGQTLTGVIRAADIALQRCKSEQKSAFRFYDTRMDDCLREQREMRVELDTALREDQLEVFYQPIVRSAESETEYYEALIRWRHPEKGLVSPGVFLPVAQEAGLMPVIGTWVLERALRDAGGWQTAGVSVNVCTSQIQKPGFAEEVAALLRKYDFPPERLILEITEDLMLEESPLTRDTFLKLRDLGVELAIDDFGTGYSSLSYLHKFRFDKMKIDRSFVWRIGQDAEADMLVRSLLGLAKVMGMQTVGEGVETEAQRAFLVTSGCDYLQGYLFDKPKPLEELADQAASLGQAAASN
ncbi:putative bifunctional diguanylate cyclase/phosphodiesterase [Roseibium sediminicola]|uniref:EAL domain-containing protein n=1 Tax=Roseibium sediminicola TaxID=2933272 RepID=A0ABT0GYL4_9HYPH|nr:EAL domain-containing protein [Roseibium sp. CAU 1639]MCK7613915.1 EAL domain-containing protein [Roseibium sp. CAU 1639]